MADEKFWKEALDIVVNLAKILSPTIVIDRMCGSQTSKVVVHPNGTPKEIFPCIVWPNFTIEMD